MRQIKWISRLLNFYRIYERLPLNWIQKVRKCFESNAILYTRHAIIEMENKQLGRIFEYEVNEAVGKGEVTGEY